MAKSIFLDAYRGMLSQLIMARRAAGMTQHDLAKALGKPQSFVSKFERAERRIDAVEFVMICRALNADCAKIINSVHEWLSEDAAL